MVHLVCPSDPSDHLLQFELGQTLHVHVTDPQLLSPQKPGLGEHVCFVLFLSSPPCTSWDLHVPLNSEADRVLRREVMWMAEAQLTWPLITLLLNEETQTGPLSFFTGNGTTGGWLATVLR